MHSYTSEAAIAAKILRNPGGRCFSVWVGTPKKQVFSTVFDPQQLLEQDATDPQIWLNVYLADALLWELIRIVRARPEKVVAWPKHANASCLHGTLRPSDSSAAILWDLFQARVDKPHPASIAWARPPVAVSARKGVAYALRDSTGVTYRHQGMLAQDTLNGNDVKDRLLVVKLVYHIQYRIRYNTFISYITYDIVCDVRNRISYTMSYTTSYVKLRHRIRFRVFPKKFFEVLI